MKRTKSLLISIFLIILFTLKVMAADYGKINFIVGQVTIIRASGDSVPAQLNSKIYANDKIITGDTGTVQIVLRGEINIRIAKKSEFVLQQEKIDAAKKKKTLLKLTFGKIWVSIKKLKKGDGLNVETPTAVVGVRGTIFALSQKNKMTTVYVGEGVVTFLSKLLGQEIQLEKGIMAKLFSDGNFSDKKQMSDQDQKEMMLGIPVFIKKSDSGSASDLKDELIKEIQQEKDDLREQRQFANRLKKEDFATGRTLKDIHGNVVRVEQIFTRNSPKSFQILNITKRDDGLAYFDLKMYYNMTLPEKLKDWGDFFIETDELCLDKQDVTLGSLKTSGKDTFRWIGTYDPDADEMNDEFYVNGKKYYGDMDKLEVIDENSDQLKTTGVLNLYTDPDNWSTETLGPKINISVYVINTEGEILSSKSFQSADNVFNLFTTTAGEIILGSDAFVHGDIDVVTIPDIAFVIIQEAL